MRWKPHVTVAAIAEDAGSFLMVEERVAGRLVYNQPAGHLDDAESLYDAVVRETLEETGWHFDPEAVIGCYRWRNGHSGETFLRIAFCGQPLKHEPDRPLDRGIVRAVWLRHDELLGAPDRMRSPLVLRCLDDYLAGNRFPLGVVQDIV